MWPSSAKRRGQIHRLLRILAGLEYRTEASAASQGRVGYLAQTLGLPAPFTVSNAIDAALETLPRTGS